MTLEYMASAYSTVYLLEDFKVSLDDQLVFSTNGHSGYNVYELCSYIRNMLTLGGESLLPKNVVTGIALFKYRYNSRFNKIQHKCKDEIDMG